MVRIGELARTAIPEEGQEGATWLFSPGNRVCLGQYKYKKSPKRETVARSGALFTFALWVPRGLPSG